MHRLNTWSKNLTLKAIKPFVDYPIEGNKLIFSDPRGVSTWLTKLIHEPPKTAIIWEPLALENNSIFKNLNFSYRQHIPTDIDWPEAKKFFDLVLSGKYINVQTAYLNSALDYLNANILIIKICRGAGLLPWLVSNYNFKYTPIYMLRHPFSVAASQLQQGVWNYKFTKFEIPNSPFNFIYKEHHNFLKSLTIKEESLVAQWCISNLFSINSPNKNKYLTIHYEDLFLNPINVISMIYNARGEDIPNKVYEKIRTPSKTTISKQELKHNQLKKWQSYFTTHQINSLKRVLEYFEVNIYDDHHLPLRLR